MKRVLAGLVLVGLVVMVSGVCTADLRYRMGGTVAGIGVEVESASNIGFSIATPELRQSLRSDIGSGWSSIGFGLTHYFGVAGSNRPYIGGTLALAQRQTTIEERIPLNGVTLVRVHRIWEQKHITRLLVGYEFSYRGFRLGLSSQISSLSPYIQPQLPQISYQF